MDGKDDYPAFKKKTKPVKFGQIGRMKDISNHKNGIQRTSWTDLRAIDFEKDEENELKALLGIKMGSRDVTPQMYRHDLKTNSPGSSIIISSTKVG